MGKLVKLLSLCLFGTSLLFSSGCNPNEKDQYNVILNTVDYSAITDVDMGLMYNFMSIKKEHYKYSDLFIEKYQQASGGYIENASKAGILVDKAKHSPDQKWHFFKSWLEPSIDDGTLKWSDSAKSRVYTKLLCPELLLWIYEACNVNTTKVKQAYDKAVEGKVNGTAVTTIAKNLREIVGWEDLLAGIKAKLNYIPLKYHVTPSVYNESPLCSFNYAGYREGDEVSFTLNITDNTKELESITLTDNIQLNNNDGVYSFIMPSKNVEVKTTFKDNSSGGEGGNQQTTNYDTIIDVDFPVEGQGSVNRYNSSFTCTASGIDFTISHASNNSNKWECIGIDTSGADNTAEIYNTKAISSKIDAISLTFSAWKATKLSSAYIYISTSSTFDKYNSVEITSLLAKGEIIITIPAEYVTTDGYYKIVFNTLSGGSSNATIKLDQIKFLLTKTEE